MDELKLGWEDKWKQGRREGEWMDGRGEGGR